MKIVIKEGDAQPKDCPVCKGKMGYKTTQLLQLYSDSVFDANGKYTNIIDADFRKPVRQLQNISCSNCNTILSFKLKP